VTSTSFSGWPDKPHLWRFVETMKAYNALQRKLEQYARPIQFRYPRYNQRPEWFTFSETSPGHMYTIEKMAPLVVEFCVFVPKEDEALLKKLLRGQPLADEETRKLDEPIDWGRYLLNPARLAERRNAYRDELLQKDADAVTRYALEPVHEWTNGVWQQLLDGFFREDPPLDMSRFTRVMVRYMLSTDVRLRPFIEDPTAQQDLIGRLVVLSNDRQKAHWQGEYQYMFGPLAEPNGSLSDRRRHLRAMPLLVGGIRLEYRGRLRDDADPIFTLSCELDERIDGPDGKRVYPVPAHRIPKKVQPVESAEDGELREGKKRKPSKKRPKMPLGLRLLCVDLGMRHVGTGVVVEFVGDGQGTGQLPAPLKAAAVEFLDAPGITLRHIERHADERRRKQRKACPRGPRKSREIRGAHLPRGQEFARELLNHTENLKDDRRKKAAHAILRAALRHKVDYIVFENLMGYRPDFEFGRRTNAALMKWNRRELVEFVRMEAQPFGILVYDFVPAHHTSRFCHRCGAAGYRFSQITRRQAAFDALAPTEPLLDENGTQKMDAKGKPVFRRRWTPHARRARGTPLGLIAGMRQAIDGGKQFCCSDAGCGLMVNADYNAAMNLARKLADDFPAYEKYSYNSAEKSWSLEGRRVTGKAFWEHTKAVVQQRLNAQFKQPAQTPPAGGWPRGFEPESIGPTPW
jgi:IS605 OrfB family transposase